MDTQTPTMPHAAPTPWWKGLIITSVLCCLILWVASWLLSDDGKPKVSEPRPRYLTKEEKRQEKRRIDAEEARLGLAAQQFWSNYEEKKLAGASLETSSRWVATASEGKHPAIYREPSAQEPAKKIQSTSPSVSLPPVNLNTETINPLMREKLRLHEDIVRNLLQ